MDNHYHSPQLSIRYPFNCPKIVADYLVHWQNNEPKHQPQIRLKVGPLINFYDHERKVHVNLIKKLDQYTHQYNFYLVRASELIEVEDEREQDQTFLEHIYCLVQQRHHGPASLLQQCIGFLQDHDLLHSVNMLPEELQRHILQPVDVRQRLSDRFGMRIFDMYGRYDLIKHYFIGTRFPMIIKIQDLIEYVHYVLELVDLLCYDEGSQRDFYDFMTMPEVELSRYSEPVPENFEIYTKQRGFTFRQEKLIWIFTNNGNFTQLVNLEIKENKFHVMKVDHSVWKKINSDDDGSIDDEDDNFMGESEEEIEL